MTCTTDCDRAGGHLEIDFGLAGVLTASESKLVFVERTLVSGRMHVSKCVMVDMIRGNRLANRFSRPIRECKGIEKRWTCMVLEGHVMIFCLRVCNYFLLADESRSFI